MAGPEPAVKQLRCPVCLVREIDVVLRPLADGGFACVKCSYLGTEADIRLRYADVRSKYRWRAVRLSPEELGRI